MKAIKRTIISIIHAILENTHYRLRKYGEFSFLDMILEQLLVRNNTVFFIQIGANDGKSFDPIYEFFNKYHQSVNGILLEPVKDYCDELRKNYEHINSVTIVNKAIHNTEKEMTIYRADPSKMSKEQLDTYAKGIASFNAEHHELSGTDGASMIGEKVECISLPELVKEHDVKEVDLLQIDTEGYDSEIILNIDFDAFKPKVISFEHGLPDGIMTQKKFDQIRDLLHSHGYELWVKHYDAIAYQSRIFH